ncbi:MAG TPA: PEP-CTERM sorting domain-containing protein [Verrucomicrobiae bacterium]|nr:PEP-CTERM sorting domain-containing protein [Verrucomicrobiae bacterium]
MKTTSTTPVTIQEFNTTSTHPRLTSKLTKSIGQILLAGAALGLALSAGAQVTYTYTGDPFSYNGSAYSYVTHVSGSFTVASPLAANTTLNLFPYTVGGTITSYSFTDGRYTLNNGNYATSNPIGYGTGGSAPTFAVTTGASGNIINWDLNILSPAAYINSYNVSSWSAPVYNTLYNEGGPSDGVVAEPSSPYDAYNFGSAGTWTVTGVPEPGTLSLMALGLGGLAWFRKHRQTVR